MPVACGGLALPQAILCGIPHPESGYTHNSRGSLSKPTERHCLGSSRPAVTSYADADRLLRTEPQVQLHESSRVEQSFKRLQVAPATTYRSCPAPALRLRGRTTFRGCYETRFTETVQRKAHQEWRSPARISTGRRCVRSAPVCFA